LSELYKTNFLKKTALDFVKCLFNDTFLKTRCCVSLQDAHNRQTHVWAFTET